VPPLFTDWTESARDTVQSVLLYVIQEHVMDSIEVSPGKLGHGCRWWSFYGALMADCTCLRS
jgi:hypothetical protein